MPLAELDLPFVRRSPQGIITLSGSDSGISTPQRAESPVYNSAEVTQNAPAFQVPGFVSNTPELEAPVAPPWFPNLNLVSDYPRSAFSLLAANQTPENTVQVQEILALQGEQENYLRTIPAQEQAALSQAIQAWVPAANFSPRRPPQYTSQVVVQTGLERTIPIAERFRQLPVPVLKPI